MAANLETIVKQLADSGIIAPGKLENFVPPKANPISVDELVAELVKNNHLTPFQAAQVKAGKAKALILGEYTILDKIGAGGMGQVFKAVHRRMDRQVAIKMLPPAMTKDAASLARFEREVRAAARLSHPNIVAAHDAGQANGAHFLVMEYVEGKDLSVMVKREGPFPVNKAVSYILQAARGLEFAHGEGVVHRDIKPANLLLDKKGVVKILDMGLARIEQAGGEVQSELTGTGTIMGTVDYMSPEQALNTRDADQRADIYSLGMSLYYLLAGKAAYAGDTAMQKLMAHQNQPIPSLQDVQTTVSKQLDAVFRKMVAKKIENRYQTMSEVVEALEGLGIGASVTGGRGDIATTMALSSDDRKKLAKAKKKPLGSITEVVASEKTKHLVLKLVGGAFATIIAPIVVTYLMRHLEKDHTPPNPPAASVPAATVPPVVVATNNPPSPPAGDGPAASGTKPWNTPAFQQWTKQVAGLTAYQQVDAVAKKLVELNPGFDGNLRPVFEGRLVTTLTFSTDRVTDISPVRALVGLRVLSCSGSGYRTGRLTDLSPLAGMGLAALSCNATQVSDLSPLAGVRLTKLYCTDTPVSDLSPLVGMPLTILHLPGTKVADVSALRAMPLAELNLGGTSVSDVSPLAECRSLALLTLRSTKVTPAQVAALQAKLPNCKIEWDGAGKPAAGGGQQAAGTKPWETPAFQKWMNDVATLPANKQVDAVAKKLQELNPGFDGKLTPDFEGRVVTKLELVSDEVTDISPVRALKGLNALNCSGSFIRMGALSNLLPLQGMKLTDVIFQHTQVSDLSPLQGMPLTKLSCGSTRVSDLSLLQGMRLTHLYCGDTQVSDLSPLHKMPLLNLYCGNTKVSALSPLESCPSLKILNVTITKVTPASVAALQAKLPNCKIEWDGAGKPGAGDGQQAAGARSWETLAFQAWIKATQALPAEKQIDAVSKKLMELNPGFDGKLTGQGGKGPPKIEDGVVTGFGFFTDNVTDISPVRALAALKSLSCCPENATGKSKLSDLSPLQGLKLNWLACSNNLVSDLWPLRGMPLTTLNCAYSQVADLSPLRGMLLMSLNCGYSRVADLSPLQGMPLEYLAFLFTQVSDLSSVEGMHLKFLSCHNTKVSDLTPLAGMMLTALSCSDTQVSDLSPLNGMKLTEVWITPQNITKGLDVIRQMKSVKVIYVRTSQRWTPDEFWKKYDAGEFGQPGQQAAKPKLGYLDPAFQQWVKATQALPAEQQIEAVSKKLMELNPGFDGKLTSYERKSTPKIEAGMVTELRFATENVADISPVRALVGLKNLSCYGDGAGRSKLSDLSPLKDMNLADLDCYDTQVSDLSPLRGMKLTKLQCSNTPVSDLSPLLGMPLTELICPRTRISDLSPLKGMKLTHLWCSNMPLSDLSPLAGMPLTHLACYQTQVSDLSPLKGMKLTDLGCRSTLVSDLSPLQGMPMISLQCSDTAVFDLSPLRGMPLTVVVFTPKKITKGLDVIRPMKSLNRIGFGPLESEQFPPAEFWKKYDAGEFGKPVAPAKLAYLDPAFQAWVKATQALPAEQQIEAVSKKLMELNPGFDGKVTEKKVENGMVVEFGFYTDDVTDISPVRALAGLKEMFCRGSDWGKGKLSDLSPLAGMPLTRLSCVYNHQVSDLSPLRGMPLRYLNCTGTQVSDLSPLHVTLYSLACSNTPISDLSPLKGMNLVEVRFTPQNIAKGLDVIRQMKSLQVIGRSTDPKDSLPPAEFWKKYDAGEFGKPAAPAKLAYLDPAFQQWVKATQALSAEQQIEAVSKKLMELNPGFDGKVTGADGKGTPKIEKRVVSELGFVTDKVADISPVRALTGLTVLTCVGTFSSGRSGGVLSNLSPLQGMPLRELRCGDSPVSDLSSLRGMPLELLYCNSTQVSDLSPLQGMLLTKLSCNNCGRLSDLSPLHGMRLTILSCNGTQVSDLSPLQGMPLTALTLASSTKVSDLEALKGMPLTNLDCYGTQVSDPTPLQGCKSLPRLDLRRTKVTPASVAALQKALPNCKIEWDDPAKPKTPEPAASGTK